MCRLHVRAMTCMCVSYVPCYDLHAMTCTCMCVGHVPQCGFVKAMCHNLLTCTYQNGVNGLELPNGPKMWLVLAINPNSALDRPYPTFLADVRDTECNTMF